ncbi:MAG: hypothetical protein HC893_06170 [Chloroflexaceae bacterium]|nr:hypothetical protein [Chloroflexaceae bacterium]
MSHRRYSLWLALALLVGLVPRLWLWYEQARAGVVYPGDQDEYYRGAIHIVLTGSYYDSGQWLRPPFLSIFLAGLFALFGMHIATVLLVQAVLSLGTLLLLAELARSMFESHRAGVMAAVLAAVFLPYASYASQLLSETLFTFLMAATLLLAEAARRRDLDWRWLLMCGMVWALATLTRPISLFALPLGVGLVLFSGLLRRIIRQPAVEALPPRRRLIGAVALVAGFVLLLAPWSLRNYAVHGHFILVDTNGGTSFWLGNLRAPDERELQFVWNETIPNLAERQQVAVARALENIRAEPLLFLSRLRNKAVSLWQFDVRLFAANAPIGITLDERSLAFAVASDVQYVLLLLLALVGIVFARRHEHHLVLLLWPVYGTLLSAVSLGHPRLRLPLIIFAFVYAALPLAHPQRIVAAWQHGERWRRVVLLGGVLALGLLWFARVYIPFGQSQFWLVQGNTERAIAAMPDNYLPYVAQGDRLRAAGDTAGALHAYDAAAERNGQSSYVQLQRLDLLRRADDAAGAQAAMDAIAAVGWGNNTLYSWAWEHLPPYLPEQIDIAAPAPGVLRACTRPNTTNAGRCFAGHTSGHRCG